MIIDDDEFLAHYGTPRKSGRYPWGSGGEDNPNTRNKTFLEYVDDMKRQGMTEVQIATGLGISTTQLRAEKSIAKNEEKQARINQAQRLKDKGMSNIAIGDRMGLNESSVRALLAPGAKYQNDKLGEISDYLKSEVADKTYVDIGAGVEQHMNISETRLRTAVAVLQAEGYVVHNLDVEQLGTGKKTKLKILTPPGTTYGEVSKNRGSIQQIGNVKFTGVDTGVYKMQPPIKVDPSRVGIRYKEEGGSNADGVIYVRPGVSDLSLGSSRYAQVRIAVGDGHYIKGMAMYKEGLPKGTDLLFNTNKSATGNKLDALKKISDDPDNPFGSIVDQITTRGADGKEQVSSAMNLVNTEGDWSKWSKTLSSQMLSKQTPKLAKEQLALSYERRKGEFDEINRLTNPVVKKALMEKFADSADSASVHLKAAALPRQASHVILPIETIAPNQVYAPNYRDGERVVLIRYPHGGTFEIPELVVNNNHTESKRLLKDARDAIGIHPSVAERLSGADFDGDTVLVIPNNNDRVSSSPALEKLKDFDPKAAYPKYPGMKPMTARTKGIEMGNVSNLITDMTIKGASHAEIAQAVRHSMVVIDAEKHELDWRQSAVDNGIAALKSKYQGGSRSGAATLISRASSNLMVPERQLRKASQGGSVDPVTGQKIYVETGKTYVNAKGKTVSSLTSTTKLAEANDANDLSSGTRIERVYVDHSNKLKNLANQARLEALNTPPAKYSPSAKKVYDAEVTSLNAKLALAFRNKPLERQAQILANATIKAKRDAYPDMDATTLKKIKFQALEATRQRTGAKKNRIEITPKEWEAIQQGAISGSKLSQILQNTDLDLIKSLATPKTEPKMSSVMRSRAASMFDLGYTRAEVADQLGVSISTLDRANGE